MSEPTYRALCYSDADCFSNFRTYLPGTLLQWCTLFKRCQNPYWALCYSGADCFSHVRTYLPGTMLQWCRLFERCQNLPTRHCVTVFQTVKAVSEPTYWALCYSGADCFSNVRTYLPGNVLQGCRRYKRCRNYRPGTVLHWCRLFKQCQYLPAGNVLQWCRLFERCQNLPTRHCVTVYQTVKAVSEPTYWALCYSGADCFSNVRTYLPGTVLQGCRLYKRCRNLPTGHCVTLVQAV